MAAEGNTSLAHGGNHMSLYTNCQVTSEKHDTSEQHQRILEVTGSNKEDSPTVVVKKTISLRMQSTIVNGAPLKISESIEGTIATEMEKVPILLPMKGPKNTAVAAEDERLIQESELVALEKTPVSLQMGTTFYSGVAEVSEEEEIPDVSEGAKDEHVLNYSKVGGHKDDERALDRREPIEESSPLVIEERPVSLHVEQVLHKEGNTEVQEPIEEVSAVAVQSEPRVCDYHPMLEEPVENENVDGNSVEVEYEPATTTHESEDEMDTEAKETITEESPRVVEKRPVSLHMEAAFDHKEEVREPVEEAPHEIIEKRPVSLHIEQMFTEEGSTEFQEPIEEASAVAVESEPRICDYHPMLEETIEGANIGGNCVEVEYEPAATTPGNKDEMETETKTTITEESPLVVEKRPVSLHMEAAFDHKDEEEVREPVEEAPHEIIEKRPVSLHIEQMFTEEGSTEFQEPIEEASAVAVESEPRICDYHPMLEETIEGANIGGNCVEVEYEPAATTPGNKDEMETETKKTITEESPLVVEKRPVSLHMEAAFDLKEEAEVRKPIEEAPYEIIQKRPVSIHMERMFNEERSDEVQEPIEEASAVAVETELKLFNYHPMLEERAEDTNVHDNSVEVEYEPVALKADPKEETKNETRETVAEESPLVVEKRPVSLHIESAFDHKEYSKEPIEEDPPQIIEKRPVSLHMENILDGNVVDEDQEPIKEASAVAVESERRICDYHPMLEETVEGENDDSNCVELKYEPAPTTLQNEKETETKTKEAITEESPLVVEKRPASVHLEAVFKRKEEEELKEPIQEAPLVAIEKRPASLHVERVLNEEGIAEAQEPIEEASAVAVESEPRVCDYHPMLEETVEGENVDADSVEVEYEPTASTHENEGETETEIKEMIAEDSPLVVEKRPVSLHMEQMLNEEGSAEVQEPIEEASAVAVESEPRVCDYHPMLEETQEDTNVDGSSVEVEYQPAAVKRDYEGETETEAKEGMTEESPLVLETRPASLHMEAVFKPKKEVKEAPLKIIEKRPVSLHMEQAFNDEGSTEVQEPTEEPRAVAVETEPRLFHYHPMLEEKAEDENIDNKSVEVEYEPAATKRDGEKEAETDTSEAISEEFPVIVETRRASRHLEVVVDRERGPEVGKPIEETPPIVIEKTPTDESQENQSVTKEQLSSVHVLDIPEVEKVKEVEDSVQEAVAPAVERKAPEFHHELLQTGDEKLEDTTLEVKVGGNQVRETEILDDEVQVPEFKGHEVQGSKRSEVITKTEVISTVTINQRSGDEPTEEMETNVARTTYEKRTTEQSNTSTSEETFASTSFTKLNQHGRDDDEELLLHVLRKRLSAPEVLPEKENDGSAPLAASEDRGILESQEQFAIADNLRKKDWTPINKPQVLGAAQSGTEPYEDIADDKKLIADAPREAEVAVDDSVENEERAKESLPVLLLLAPEEEKGDHANKEKKEKTSGPPSPQCKCCVLM